MTAPATQPRPVSPPSSSHPPVQTEPVNSGWRTVATLGLLSCALPANLALTGAALLRGVVRGRPHSGPAPGAARTILISGGKMTKALHLARAFHRAGHRVVLVEAARYRLSGHRFSRAVDRFYPIPPAGSPDYVAALVEISRREGVDVYVPVCSPASAVDDARAKAALEEYCEVLHFDPDTLGRLDDKHRFAQTAAGLGLPVPDAHRIVDPDQVADFDYDAGDPPYILKSIAYDPIRRMDLTRLPRPTRADTRAFAARLPIGPDNPWVLQSFVSGREYCTHATARHGRVTVHACCASSAFQLNYEMADVAAIEEWVRRFVAGLELTGQVSLDFIVGDDGRPYAIECNPRTHSAITMFYDQPAALAGAYLDDEAAPLTPTPASRPTYWLYHELAQMIRCPAGAAQALRRIAAGKEAIFDWDDPLPFLLVHHLQIPALLIANLRGGRRWARIDFNIGKLVEPGGD